MADIDRNNNFEETRLRDRACGSIKKPRARKRPGDVWNFFFYNRTGIFPAGIKWPRMTSPAACITSGVGP